MPLIIDGRGPKPLIRNVFLLLVSSSTLRLKVRELRDPGESAKTTAFRNPKRLNHKVLVRREIANRNSNKIKDIPLRRAIKPGKSYRQFWHRNQTYPL
jgi:hypothetical protein